MTKLRIFSILLTVIMILSIFSGCSQEDTSTNPSSGGDILENEIVDFRPVDCGFAAQDSYEFPFLGMEYTLPDEILSKMKTKEIFALTDENYMADYSISYGVMRFSVTEEEHRNAEEVSSVDIYGFESGLVKFGAIGVYHKSVLSQLDELTACDTHKKVGASKNGNYEYYISTNSKGDKKFASALLETEIAVIEMHKFDPNAGYTAFSADKIEGVEGVGEFSTTDVFGKKYTESVFAENDLTLVNAFTTWCSPCVEEMPELEKLRADYEKKGVKFGVVAVVLDIKTEDSTDEGALERAKTLHKRSGANFPFLIPDNGEMNGRLTGIASVPESFFVDKNGNIVSDAIVGARSQEEWAEIVDAQLSKTK